MFKIKNRICIICSNEYKPTGTTQKYCFKCKKNAKKIYQKQIILKKHSKQTKKCQICGKDFFYIHKRKRFCSDNCISKFFSKKRKSTKKNYKKNCINCGKYFETTFSFKKYCSEYCSKNRSINARLRFKILKRDNFTCQYCGQKAPDVVLNIDHIEPFSKGGKTNEKNLITSCFLCNIGKTNIY